MFKKIIISITCFLSVLVSGYSQTTYFDLPGGGAFPAGWSNTNNIAAQPIDKSSYHLVEPGSPGDLITTSSYDLVTIQQPH